MELDTCKAPAAVPQPGTLLNMDILTSLFNIIYEYFDSIFNSVNPVLLVASAVIISSVVLGTFKKVVIF